MKDITLISYLAESAYDLARKAESADPVEARSCLEKSAEMLALGASLLKQDCEGETLAMREAA